MTVVYTYSVRDTGWFVIGVYEGTIDNIKSRVEESVGFIVDQKWSDWESFEDRGGSCNMVWQRESQDRIQRLEEVEIVRV